MTLHWEESEALCAAQWRQCRCVGDAVGAPRINQDANLGQRFARQIDQLSELDCAFSPVELVKAMCHEVGPRLSMSHQVPSSATPWSEFMGLDGTKCHLVVTKCHQRGLAKTCSDRDTSTRTDQSI